MAYVVTKCLLGKLLKEAGMSKAELSRRTGINANQISDYISLRYRDMGLERARTIAEVLGLDSPYCLYEWKDVPPSRRTD